MADIRNVVVLGATGNVGRHIVDALLNDQSRSFHVRIARRSSSDSSSSSSTLSNGAEIFDVDYNSVESLKKLFANQHAIIEAFNPSAAIYQANIVQAALETESVRHIITPDFSSDTFNAHCGELMIFEPKIKAQAVLEEACRKRPDLHWTAIITGPFFDWAIPRGIFWVNPQTRKVTIFGSGNQRVSMSAIDIVGRAAVTVLKNPNAFQDRPAYFADYTVSSNELLKLLNEIDQENDQQNQQPWKADTIPLDNFFDQAKQLWAQDTARGVQDRLNTRAYQMLGTYGLFDEGNRYGADFGDRVESGFGVTRDEFREMLRRAITSQ